MTTKQGATEENETGTDRMKVVLKVISVRAYSGKTDGPDTTAIRFLQDNSFTRIARAGKGMLGYAPQDGPAFLLEIDDTGAKVELPFTLVRVDNGVRKDLDTGHTIYVQRNDSPKHEISGEVSGIGEHMMSWTVQTEMIPPEVATRLLRQAA